jgi:hypothetical protein
MMSTTRDDVIRYLGQCSGGELSEILRQVFEGRPEAEDEGIAFQYRLVFGVAARENISDKVDQIEWGPWQIAAVAYVDPSKYSPGFPGEPFLQYGTCESCRIEVCSHVKEALCPTCGGSVHLT